MSVDQVSCNAGVLCLTLSLVEKIARMLCDVRNSLCDVCDKKHTSL